MDQYHIDRAIWCSVYLSVNASQIAILSLPIRGLVTSELVLVYQPSQATLNDLSVAAGETALTELKGFQDSFPLKSVTQSYKGLIVQPGPVLLDTTEYI